MHWEQQRSDQKKTSIEIHKNIMADALHTSKCPKLYYITV